MKILYAGIALFLFATVAHAQQTVPFVTAKPVFVPGMYESESRNSHFKNKPVKSKSCIASADFDHFRDETLQQYRSSPQFNKACKLSETKHLSNGFAFAMDCRESKSIVIFRFSKDIVAQIIETLIPRRRSASSSILTMMRRVGDCPGQKPPGLDV